MPTYQYECSTCQTTFEIKQGFEDPPLSVCLVEDCEGKPIRVINPVGIVFKGSGFYINDSKEQAKSKSEKDQKSEKSEKSEESEKSEKSEKPETSSQKEKVSTSESSSPSKKE